MEKLFQLYEMILVRHGLMLVGYSYGAKTCIYQMLAGALNDLKAQNLLDENKVKIVVINPKSIYMGQLYAAIRPGESRVAGRHLGQEVQGVRGGYQPRSQVGDVRQPGGRHLD